MFFSVLFAALVVTQPAEPVELTIPSHGSNMITRAFLPEGEGPHPVALFLHGYPGNEKNEDIALAASEAGWASFVIRYRGAWGSEGEFSFMGAEQDVVSAVEFLSSDQAIGDFNLDPDHIAVIGHSMGGHMAFSGAIDDTRIDCVVSLAGANAGYRGPNWESGQREALRQMSDDLPMLAGWTGDRAIEELETYQAELDLLPRLHEIGSRPVLFIASPRDRAVSYEDVTLPVVETLNEVDGSDWRLVVLDEDHGFSGSRDEVAGLTVDFLERSCR